MGPQRGQEYIMAPGKVYELPDALAEEVLRVYPLRLCRVAGPWEGGHRCRLSRGAEAEEATRAGEYAHRMMEAAANDRMLTAGGRLAPGRRAQIRAARHRSGRLRRQMAAMKS